MKTSYLSALFFILMTALSINAQKKTENFLTQRGITSIAVLPPTGESVPSNVREIAAATFVSGIEKQMPEIKILDALATFSLLEKASQLDNYVSFLNLFVKTGTINRAALTRMGEAINSSGILLIDVQRLEAQNGSWLRGRNGHNDARVQYTLFSPSGEKIWQHLVVYVHTPTGTAKADKAEKVMQSVNKRALSALIKGTQNTDPRKDVEP